MKHKTYNVQIQLKIVDSMHIQQPKQAKLKIILKTVKYFRKKHFPQT